MGDRAAPQCWECLRRQVACDGAEPICGNCISTHLVCPGYKNERRLRWFPVGQVSRLRNSKKNTALKGRTFSKTGARKTASLTRSNRMGNDGASRDVARLNRNDGGSVDEEVGLVARYARGSERVLAHQYREQAALQQQILVPNYDLAAKECHLAEAIEFWNEAVIPFSMSQRVGMKSYLRPIDPAYVQSKASSWRYIMVSLVVSHQLSIISHVQDLGLDYTTSSLTVATRSRFHNYFGLAIRALNDEISRGKSGDLESILQTIIILGSVEKPFAYTYSFVGNSNTTILNTTSPSHDQITEISNFNLIDLQTFLNVDTFPIFLSPPYLLLDVVRINRLRSELATTSESESWRPGLCKTCEIMRHIDAFMPEDWVKSHGLPLEREHILLSKLFQCAVALFATLSTPCAYGASDPNSICHILMPSYRIRLFQFVGEIPEAGLNIFDAFWPVLVAGVAATGTNSTHGREAVERLMLKGVQDPFTGTVPKVAYSLLQRFWESGKTGWDDCFDKPYYLAL
ncbi:Phomenoic acid biosynthesis cluster-specific transcriptional regulator-like protein [Cladobotryum mycophilum]|uniref:Phomenoic acid biosynthesis cluster-specific transcriptional regulator-like protein n=1 Tax=Cladobotryum mycophilum TaxID=491253 RepID=A0ABR0SA50_9HYPO